MKTPEQSSLPRRSVGDNVAVLHRCVPALPGRDEPQISLCVIVEAAEMFHVRRAVFQAGGQSVQIIKGLPMPHSSKVRLYITMKAGALDQIRNAVMAAISAGEFGPARGVS